MQKSDWESLCRRCGQCCFEKWIEADGRVLHTRVACRYFDVTTRACRVYAKRLEVGEGCIQLTPENIRELTWLPADCGYVEFLSGTRDTVRGTRKSRNRR